VWDVIPVSVSEPDNSTDDNRNNNNCSMEDGNGNNGYSENLVSRNGLVYTTCKPKGTRRRNCNIIHTRRGLTENSQGISSLVEAFKLFFDKAIIDIIIKYTNQRGERCYEEWNTKNPTKQRKVWMPTDEVEIQAFLGVL
jgi:hypothetical protein